MEIEYKGIIYNVKQDEFESDDTFYERMWIIAKQEPKSEEEYKKAISYSRLWINNKMLGCQFTDKLNKISTNLDELIYS